MAIDPVTGLLIGGGTSLVSGLLGGAAAKRGERAARRAAARRLAEYSYSDIPKLEEQQLALLAPELLGEYRPEVEQFLELDPSLLQDVSADEQLIQNQQEALEQLNELSEGGLTAGEMAQARELQRQVDRAGQARQKAVLQNMAQRGVLGSGMELAARLGSSQADTERQASQQDELMKQAQARAMQALGQKADLSGQMRSQGFSEASQRARAADEIARANLMNQMGVQQRNISARNQAQMQNLQARQAIENERARLANLQQQHNKGLYQQQFQNRMQIAGGRTGAHAAAGQAAQQAAAGQANMIGQIGSGLVGMIGGMVNSKATPNTQAPSDAPGTGSNVGANNSDIWKKFGY